MNCTQHRKVPKIVPMMYYFYPSFIDFPFASFHFFPSILLSRFLLFNPHCGRPSYLNRFILHFIFVYKQEPFFIFFCLKPTPLLLPTLMIGLPSIYFIDNIHINTRYHAKDLVFIVFVLI